MTPKPPAPKVSALGLFRRVSCQVILRLICVCVGLQGRAPSRREGQGETFERLGPQMIMFSRRTITIVAGLAVALASALLSECLSDVHSDPVIRSLRGLIYSIGVIGVRFRRSMIPVPCPQAGSCGMGQMFMARPIWQTQSSGLVAS